MSLETKRIIEELGKAYAWEYHSIVLYQAYSVTVDGAWSWLAEKFEKEAEESFGHAKKVLGCIDYLNGMPPKTLSFPPVKHTEDVQEMLQEALANEAAAAKQYKKIVDLAKGDSFLLHEANHLLIAELEGQHEIKTLMGLKK